MILEYVMCVMVMEHTVQDRKMCFLVNRSCHTALCAVYTNHQLSYNCLRCIHKTVVALQVSALSHVTILQNLFFNATKKLFMFSYLPKFQAIHQLRQATLRCDIPLVPLQYTVAAEMYPIYAQIHCSYYKWQLHVSSTQQPSSGCLCDKSNRKCYTCSLHKVETD